MVERDGEELLTALSVAGEVASAGGLAAVMWLLEVLVWCGRCGGRAGRFLFPFSEVSEFGRG